MTYVVREYTHIRHQKERQDALVYRNVAFALRLLFLIFFCITVMYQPRKTGYVLNVTLSGLRGNMQQTCTP